MKGVRGARGCGITMINAVKAYPESLLTARSLPTRFHTHQICRSYIRRIPDGRLADAEPMRT